MKVTIEQSALIKSLGHIHRVVERRTTIPILSNVLLRADSTGLQLKATDLDLEATEAVPAEVSRPGSTTVPAHTLHEIVRKLADGAQVSLDADGDGQMILRSGRSKFTLQTLPESDFPNLAAGDMTHKFSLPAGDLKRLLDQTQFAISSEEVRYYLNGVFMHVTDNNDFTSVLRAVATDGHRLARVDTKAPASAAGMPGIIIPRKATGEVQKLIEDPAAEVIIELSATKIRFTIGNVILTSKLIDGSFPDYARVIPAHNHRILTIDRREFSEAVDRVSTISSDRGRAVKLAISPGRAVLSVVNVDAGSAVEELEANYTDDPLEIGFNARYLAEISSQIKSPEVMFKFNDSGSPTIVMDEKDNSAIFVLMPMRV